MTGASFGTALVSTAAAALVMGAVWLPHVGHYRLPGVRLTATEIEAARRSPTDSLLRELERMTPGFLLARPTFEQENPEAAERLLSGQVDIPGLASTTVTLPFSPADLEAGPGEWQLAFAALTLPEVLLRAYARTGQERYLAAARDMIVAWAHYERGAWLPRGFLWNDHAVAARLPVLSNFWLAYRGHPLYDPAVGATVLAFAARTAAMLAAPAHFTAGTNHGVMQNLALWHFALAFPALPEAARYRATALDRLTDQMGFYVDDEGVVLEHSAGYHRDGVGFLGMALRYLTLTHTPAPDPWVEKYRRAVAFYVQLRRPDGSLPLVGDTGDAPDRAGPAIAPLGSGGRAEPLAPPATWPAPEPWSLYPVAGYAVWWGGLAPSGAGPLSQTLVGWSYFPGHGHKHADEMSVLVWAAGQTWLSNVGYWPYDTPGRAQTESWPGSNAPHLVGEPARSLRTTRLLASGWSPSMAALDLERRRQGGSVHRRQVSHVAPALWIVMDRASGAPADRTRTQWTTSPDVQLRATETRNLYRLTPKEGSGVMTLAFAASPEASVRQLRGSMDLFGGWQVTPRGPTPSDTLVIEQAASGSWTITVWCLDSSATTPAACPDRPVSAELADDENWSVTVPLRPMPLKVWRAGGTLYRQEGGRGTTASLVLVSPPDSGPPRAAIRAAFEAVIAKYPRFRDLGDYRLRVVYVLLGVFAIQEVGLWLRPRALSGSGLRLALVGLWVVGGFWLTLIYLR
jgi:hypothetical protein